MITENKIRELVGEKIKDTDYYILNVDIKPGNNIRVELERMSPVSIEDCVEISRQIEHNLDREEEDFSLQVSSPGLDKPLRDHRQYIKNIGRELKIRTEDKDFVGRLVSANEESITVHVSRKERVEGKKKKVLIEEDIEMPYTKIKEAKIKINFK